MIDEMVQAYERRGLKVTLIKTAQEYVKAVEALPPGPENVIVWVDPRKSWNLQVYPAIAKCPACKTDLVPHTSAGRGFYRDHRRLMWCSGCFRNWEPVGDTHGKVRGFVNVPKRIKRSR